MRTLLLVLLAGLLAGCSVNAPQVDMVRRAIPEAKPDVDIDPYAWTMEFNGAQLILYAVQAEDGTVFANREGTQVGFDGTDVVLLRGMPGSLGSIRVRRGEGGVRTHVVSGLGEYAVRCDAPRRAGAVIVTACEHEEAGRLLAFEHRVRMDEQGSIVEIEAVLIPGARPMRLTPLRTEEN